jgi:hypothetical protein
MAAQLSLPIHHFKGLGQSYYNKHKMLTFVELLGSSFDKIYFL